MSSSPRTIIDIKDPITVTTTIHEPADHPTIIIDKDTRDANITIKKETQSDCLNSGTACVISHNTAIKVESVHAGSLDSIEQIARKGFEFLDELSLRPVASKGCTSLEERSLKPAASVGCIMTAAIALPQSPWANTGNDIHDFVMTYQITLHMLDMSGKGCILHQYVSFVNLLCQDVMEADLDSDSDYITEPDGLRPVSEIPFSAWPSYEAEQETDDSSDEQTNPML